MKNIFACMVLVCALSCTSEERDCLIPGVCPQLLVEPKLEVTPELIAYDCVNLGCEQSRTLLLANRGGGTLAISSIRLSQNSSPDFSTSSAFELLSADKPFILSANESVEVQINYRPSDGISDEAILLVDWQSGRREIAIRSRTLGEKSARASESSLNFGHVAVGKQSLKYLSVENTSSGNAVVSIDVDRLALPKEAFMIAATLPLHLNPGQKADIPIVFEPKHEGVFEQRVFFIVRDANSSKIEVRLLGTSVPSSRISIVNPSDGIVDFGTLVAGDTSTQNILLRNEGLATLSFSASVRTSFPNSFSLREDAIAKNWVLSPMESAMLPIIAAPTIGGQQDGFVQILSALGDFTSIEIPLRMSVVAPELAVSAQKIEFPSIALGWTTDNKEVQISNKGVGELIIDDIQLSADSSPFIRLTGIPPLPLKLMNNDSPIGFGVTLAGNVLGDVFGKILIRTNSIDNAASVVDVTGKVLTCDEQCGIHHASSDCVNNRCEIRTCHDGWHDADKNHNSGCECQEDFSSKDVGATCSEGLQLGFIGDGCSRYDTVKRFKGTLHDKNDVDIFFVRAEDASGYFCDFFGDSFEVSVSLESAPPGLLLCVNMQPLGSGCGGYKQAFDPNICGEMRYARQGNYGSDNSSDVTAWTMWHPDAHPQCGEYELIFRSKR